ncbi:glutamate-rich protein 1 [Rhinophrynus dorsalis]
MAITPSGVKNGCKKESLANPRIYTVSLPPEDYVPRSQNDCKSSSTEESGNQEDLEGDLLIRKRKRRRRKKKTNVTPPLAPENEHKSSEIVNPSLTSVHEPINKNKRRKLQRKHQKERVKAAGLWKKSSEDSVAHKNEADELGRGTLAHTSESHTEEDLKKMSHDLLDFLQATQEIYFADGKSKCTDSALSDSVILEILQQIESGELPSSDIIHLHHIKSLLRLQDIERLKDVLDNFKVHSSLPNDHRTALSSLFLYWITDILPIQNKE